MSSRAIRLGDGIRTLRLPSLNGSSYSNNETTSIWPVAATTTPPSSIVLPLIEVFNAYIASAKYAQESLRPTFVDRPSELNDGFEGGSTAKAVRKAYESSGLTWDQLARVFSVSRRSVHLWVNGSRMNATNVEMLMQFVELVNHMNEASPDERRAALLAVDGSGLSAIDKFRKQQQLDRRAEGGVEQRPDTFLGALHDDPVK